MALLDHAGVKPEGKNAVVIGRSNIVVSHHLSNFLIRLNIKKADIPLIQ